MVISSWDPYLASFLKNLAFGPGPFLLLLFLLPFIGTRVARARAPFRRSLQIGALSAAVFFLYCSSFFSKALRLPLHALSDQGVTADCLTRAKAIVVLGGGIVNDRLPATPSIQRIQRAADTLNESLPPARPPIVVLSGGTTGLGAKKVVPEAQVYDRYLRMLLSPETLRSTRILLEQESQNTYQNAAFTRKLMEQNEIPLSVAVVTSSLHMPRSLATFRKAGFEACAVPVISADDRPPPMFSFGNAVSAQDALNEWIGLAGYKFKGWL